MAGMTESETVTAMVASPQGGQLEVLTSGPPDGFPLLYHSGTPSAAVPFPLLERAATSARLRLVTYSRPGYGHSDPRGEPGTLVDDVADSVAVLDALGAAEFVTLGWSGGGPRALACAAALSSRCRAAATLAGVAPREAEGLDWFAGMGQENLDEFAAALTGRQALEEWLGENGTQTFQASADEVAAALGDLASEVDRGALSGELADYVARAFRHAGRQDLVGWRDDDLVLVEPWGFDLDTIRVPVSIWQGGQDRMVPFSHGQWLADRVSGARVHLYPEEGHISLVAQVDRILAGLVEDADLPTS